MTLESDTEATPHSITFRALTNRLGQLEDQSYPGDRLTDLGMLHDRFFGDINNRRPVFEHLQQSLTDAERFSDVDHMLKQYEKRVETVNSPQQFLGLLVDPPSMMLFVVCLLCLCHIYLTSQLIHADNFPAVFDSARVDSSWPGFQTNWLSQWIHALSFCLFPFAAVVLYVTPTEGFRHAVGLSSLPGSLPTEATAAEALVSYVLMSICWMCVSLNERKIIAGSPRASCGKMPWNIAQAICGGVLVVPILTSVSMWPTNKSANFWLLVVVSLLHYGWLILWHLLVDYSPSDRFDDAFRSPRIGRWRRTIHDAIWGKFGGLRERMDQPAGKPASGEIADQVRTLEN